MCRWRWPGRLVPRGVFRVRKYDLKDGGWKRHAPPAAAGYDRRLEGFGEGADFFAGVHCAAADEYYGVACLSQEPRSLFNGACIHRWSAHGLGQWTVVHFRLACKNINRHFQADGPRPVRIHFTEGHCQQAGQFGGAFNAARPFGQRTQNPELIGDFVQHTETAADLVGMDLAGEAEEGAR